MSAQETRPVDVVLERLPDHRQSGSGWSARCPAHDDRQASLSIAEGEDGRVLLKCHAGCDTGQVLVAVGLTMTDLFPRSNGNVTRLRGVSRQLEATYDYLDADRRLVVQKVRYFPKDFALRHPDGNGGWIWNTKHLRSLDDVPLYNLADVRMARAEQLPVWVAEGEKDCDALTRRGEVSTTNVGGAGKWRPSAAAELADIDVVVVADRDEAGRKHALDVARSLRGVAATLRVVESDRAKDAFEHFARAGDFADFVDVDWWPETRAEPEPAPDKPVAPDGGLVRASSVSPVRLQWLWKGWLPRGKLAILDGDPGVGKSVLSLDLVSRVTYGGAMPGRPDDERSDPANVLLLAAEDGFADTVVPRLMAAGADRDRVYWLPDVAVVNEDGKIEVRPPELPTDVELIERHVVAHDVALVVVDVLYAFLAERVNSWADAAVRRAMAPLHRMADSTGCVVLLLRHLNKGSAGGPAIYRGGGSIGLAGAARSVLMAGRDPRQPEATNAFVLCQGKENLAARQSSCAYELAGNELWDVPQVRWRGRCDVTAEDLVSFRPAGHETRSEDAAEWLVEYLSDGPVEWNELRRDAAASGFSETTLRKAARSQHVVIRRVGKGRKHRSTWGLPDGESP